jgi:very-short-patch-repair endonuclease
MVDDREMLERARAMRQNMTRAETILWTRLRKRQVMGLHFRRQKRIGSYFTDFVCAKARLVVEVDGPTHTSEDQRAYDARRERFIERAGWTVFRVWNSEVYGNEDGVVEAIMERVREEMGR